MRGFLLAALLLGLIVVTLAQPLQPVPKKDPAASNGPEDIHIHVVKTAHSTAKASETISGIEAKFNNGHDKVMRRLNKALRKITKHVDGNKNAEILLRLRELFVQRLMVLVLFHKVLLVPI